LRAGELLQASIRVTDAYRYYVAWLLCGVYTISLMDRQLVSVLTQPIRAEFGLKDAHMGLITGLSFALFYATFGLPLGRLADRTIGSLRIIVVVNLWSAIHYFVAARTLRAEAAGD